MAGRGIDESRELSVEKLVFRVMRLPPAAEKAIWTCERGRRIFRRASRSLAARDHGVYAA